MGFRRCTVNFIILLARIVLSSILEQDVSVNEDVIVEKDVTSSLDPVFLSTDSEVTVRDGGLAVLPCAVTNLGNRQVAWRRLDNDHFLTIGTLTWVKDLNIQIEHRRVGEVSFWDLLIKHVSPDHEGVYECQVTSVKKFVRHVALHVQGTVLKGRQLLQQGEELKLVCNTTGKTKIPDDVDWFKDGQPINSSRFSHVVVTNYRSLGSRTLVSVLSVNRSRSTDSGHYMCKSPVSEIDTINVTVWTDLSSSRTDLKALYRPIVNMANKHCRPQLHYFLYAISLLVVFTVMIT